MLCGHLCGGLPLDRFDPAINAYHLLECIKSLIILQVSAPLCVERMNEKTAFLCCKSKTNIARHIRVAHSEQMYSKNIVEYSIKTWENSVLTSKSLNIQNYPWSLNTQWSENNV